MDRSPTDAEPDCSTETKARRWTHAVDVARQLVIDYPGDIDAEWALTVALYNAGELDKAWSALITRGRALLPRSRVEVVIWLRLNSRYNSDSVFIDEALDTVRNWSDDEVVLGTLIQVMLGLEHGGTTVTEAQGQQIRASIEQFTEKFPESRFLRAVPLGPADDPLAPMQDLLREANERFQEAERKVSAGEAPLGLLSDAASRTYAEASLRRAAHGVLAEMPKRPDDEALAAADTRDTIVVIDVTTAHTLTLLDRATRDSLLGYCRSVVVSDSTYKDALVARDSLHLKSTLTVAWDSATNRPIAHRVSEEQAGLLADRAEQTLQILGSATRQSYPSLTHFPDDMRDAIAWLCAIDMAKTSGYAFWCDDRVLRRVAASMGVPTFGTAALLDVLATRGVLGAEHAEVARATLLHNYYFDLDFNIDAYTLAASLDAYRPEAVAAAVRRPAAWANPELTTKFVLGMVRRAANSSPEDLQGWCHAGATGLLAIAARDPDMCSSNLAVLLQRCMGQAWCDAARLPFVLAGIRDAMDESCERPVRDPLEGVLRQLYPAATRQLGHSAAKSYLLDLVGQGSESDKLTAARVILSDLS